MRSAVLSHAASSSAHKSISLISENTVTRETRHAVLSHAASSSAATRAHTQAHTSSHKLTHAGAHTHTHSIAGPGKARGEPAGRAPTPSVTSPTAGAAPPSRPSSAPPPGYGGRAGGANWARGRVSTGWTGAWCRPGLGTGAGLGPLGCVRSRQTMLCLEPASGVSLRDSDLVRISLSLSLACCAPHRLPSLTPPPPIPASVQTGKRPRTMRHFPPPLRLFSGPDHLFSGPHHLFSGPDHLFSGPHLLRAQPGQSSCLPVRAPAPQFYSFSSSVSFITHGQSSCLFVLRLPRLNSHTGDSLAMVTRQKPNSIR